MSERRYFSVYLAPETLERVERIAAGFGMTRNSALNWLIASALDDWEYRLNETEARLNRLADRRAEPGHDTED